MKNNEFGVLIFIDSYMLHNLQDKQNKAAENKYKLLNSPTTQVRFGWWKGFLCILIDV
jgi:hypothetical protein